MPPLPATWSAGDKMDLPTTSAAGRVVPSKRPKRPFRTIHDLGGDVLCKIFSLVDDVFDLVYRSTVCKSWYSIIHTSKLFHTVYCKQQVENSSSSLDLSTCSDREMRMKIQELAMNRHRISLEKGSIDIYQWRDRSSRIYKCRMKKGLLLTGGSDEVIRLWSVESYKCLGEYCLPKTPLVDFDFDESKVVGLVGTRICLWRRNLERNRFFSRQGEFPKGTSLCYVDPEAVVGCEDGRARVFDLYSRQWSKTIKMHEGPVTCLSFSDDHLLIGGSSHSRISISNLSSDQQVGLITVSTDRSDITTLCRRPSSNLLFAGSGAGRLFCADLRTMTPLWNRRVSPNMIHSIHHLLDDNSTLAIGGIDGVLRFVDQQTGKILSSCIMDESSSQSNRAHGSNVSVECKKGRRLSEDARIDLMSKAGRPSISCLAVGMQKVATVHDDRIIRVWRFNK